MPYLPVAVRGIALAALLACAPGAAPATAITRSFDVDIEDGGLRLDVVPETGEAVLSNLAVERL
jgi:beta-galactosidase